MMKKVLHNHVVRDSADLFTLILESKLYNHQI